MTVVYSKYAFPDVCCGEFVDILLDFVDKIIKKTRFIWLEEKKSIILYIRICVRYSF